jgi:hypothetical protein
VSNIYDMILKFINEMIWYILFPMELVELNFDSPSFGYDNYTKKTYLRLVLGLVENPNLHILYL